jgi:hypothetical protein
MHHLVCTPEVAANLALSFGISAVVAVVVVASVLRWRSNIKDAIEKGVARARSLCTH